MRAPRLLPFLAVLVALLAARPASAARFEVVVADSIAVTLCDDCGMSLSGLDWALVANTGAADLTPDELREARFTVSSTNDDVVLAPFVNLPSDSLPGAIHPGEVVGSVIDGNRLLVSLVHDGESLRGLDGHQFMAYTIERRGPNVGPVDFRVTMALAGEIAGFVIHANVSAGPQRIEFLGAHRVSSVLSADTHRLRGARL